MVIKGGEKRGKGGSKGVKEEEKRGEWGRTRVERINQAKCATSSRKNVRG